MADSNQKARRQKAQKPRKDFPLFPHATNRWAKKVRGKLHYFGSTRDDPKGEAALARWLDEKDDLLAGRTPRPQNDGLLIRDLCNHFLTRKKDKLDTGEIKPSTFRDYHRTCSNIVAFFGATRAVDDLRPDDFGKLRAELSRQRGLVALGNEVNRVRIIFKHGMDYELTERVIKFGPDFKRPVRRLVKQERQRQQQVNGKRMFAAEELRWIISEAPQPLKAMILLGVNCGFGQTDVANLPKSAFDFPGAWVNFPRPKTAVERRCPLWPETIGACKSAILTRPNPKDAADDALCFLTRWGRKFVRESDCGSIDTVAQQFRKFLIKQGVFRERVNFYALRHTCETIGGESRDQVAVDAIMGHADQSMASHYREGISDERLIAVTEHVRTWLFGETDK